MTGKRSGLFLILLAIFFTPSCSEGEEEKDNTKTLDGKELYEQSCSTCHGPKGKKGVSGAKDLSRSELSLEERMRIIREGKGAMIPFEGQLSEEEIRAIAKYLEELRKKE